MLFYPIDVFLVEINNREETMSEFQLHPQLVADTVIVGEFALSLLLLSKDANYPWFILVPKQDNISEIHQLNDRDRMQLMIESCQLAEGLEKAFDADKINIAALGNMVPQLHVHHVVRYKNDPSWPAPIWGAVPAIKYDVGKIAQCIDSLLRCLDSNSFRKNV